VEEGELNFMKNVIVFGGSGRIGSAIGKSLFSRENNYSIYNADLENNWSLIPPYLSFIQCNILNAFSVHNALDFVQNTHGNIHAIIDCTYPRTKRYMKHPWYTQPLDDFSTFWNMHLTRAVMLCQFAKEFNIKNVVLLSSMYGSIIPEEWVYEGSNVKRAPLEYCTSKAGLEHLVRYVSKDIHVNAIAPAGIEDPTMDNIFKENYRKRYGEFTKVEDIAALTEFLISDKCNLNGQVIHV
jgi:NAD(P)-dependent dehydrogenase (short-subunit alcohol dehydrogenase family)